MDCSLPPFDGRAFSARRWFLRLMAGGLGGLCGNWVGSLRAGDTAGGPTKNAKAKSVILIFNCGAPSHIDLWDPKPAATDTVRGEFATISTAVPGIHVTELLPNLARRMDRLAAIGEMAATVAHEIRNPLGGIRGFATLLQRDVEASDPRARLVEKILAGVKSLEEVVNELLEYTRPVHLDRKRIACAELVEGAAEVCRAAGVALVGGETAELPGIYRDEELDFAGTCVGVVAEDSVIDGSVIEEGDVVVGLPSAGVHANGFTLVRRVLEVEDYRGHDLLAPTRLYLDDVRRLRDRAHGFAHVTGGGILGNLSRVLPEGLVADIDWDAWERPPVFRWLARHVEEDELRKVFNLGIGYLAVVAAGENGHVIGRIVRA